MRLQHVRVNNYGSPATIENILFPKPATLDELLAELLMLKSDDWGDIKVLNTGGWLVFPYKNNVILAEIPELLLKSHVKSCESWREWNSVDYKIELESETDRQKTQIMENMKNILHDTLLNPGLQDRIKNNLAELVIGQRLKEHKAKRLEIPTRFDPCSGVPIGSLVIEKRDGFVYISANSGAVEKISKEDADLVIAFLK